MAALVLAVAIPLGVVLGYGHYAAIQREEATASDTASQLARIGAQEVEAELGAVRSLLEYLAQQPPALTFAGTACGGDRTRVHGWPASLGPLLLVDASGRPACSGMTIPPGDAPYASATWLQSIAAGRGTAPSGATAS
jgi:hypothetical protein